MERNVPRFGVRSIRTENGEREPELGTLELGTLELGTRNVTVH